MSIYLQDACLNGPVPDKSCGDRVFVGVFSSACYDPGSPHDLLRWP